ncbi:MAG: hypothetical protein PQJ46_15230 [Spirochaetales bacterium]|nr:hypothetical protein [Spirochaetales bacterium]
MINREMVQPLCVVLMTAIFSTAFTGCVSTDKSDEENISIQGSYSIHVGAYDWGPGVNSVLVKLNTPIDSVKIKDFSVVETKQVTDWSNNKLPVIEKSFSRKITDAYLVDNNGNKIQGSSEFIQLQLACSPTEGSPFLCTMEIFGKNVWANPYTLDISLSETAKITTKGKLVNSININPVFTSKTSDADNFNSDVFTASNGEIYKYAFFEPENKTDTLIVWLHGAGEGGAPEGYISDIDVTLLGNEVTALASDTFQTAVGGAKIVAPQCYSMWMDDGSGMYTKDGTSKYTESLKEFLDFYRAKCGAKKVILSGCSNGGFMVLNLIMKYPGEFTAGVPCCEAYNDTWITEDMLQTLADTPIYFIYSKDDPIIVPTEYEIPTIERLQKLGANKLEVSTSDEVINKSGLYKTDNGSPYKYNGHWSWIYFFNDESVSDFSGISSWEWISKQINIQ